MEEGGLVIASAFTSRGWLGEYVSLGNSCHQDALWEEGKPMEAV